jgi:predicted DNA-binding transcriptional regulator YafY
MVSTPGGRPTVDAELLTSIGTACRDHQRLRFDYRGLGGASSIRVTEPHELLTWGSRWYLVA